MNFTKNQLKYRLLLINLSVYSNIMKHSIFVKKIIIEIKAENFVDGHFPSIGLFLTKLVSVLEFLSGMFKVEYQIFR